MAIKFDSPEVKKKFADARRSPEAFARLFLGITPTEQQKQLMEAISVDGAKVSVRSGHGAGKSAALACIALWFLATRKDALIPCTAPTAHQLQDVLWREIRRLIGKMSKQFASHFIVTQDKVTLSGSAGMIVARTARPENPDALQGFHAENILFIIDEAAGVDNVVFEVAGGALSTPNARVVMTANPTQLTGYFYDSHHKNRDAWTRLHFSCLDSPLVAPEYAKGMALEYGEDSDIYRVRVLGDFPRHGLLSIISAERVDAAFSSKLPPDAVRGMPVILGVDPAWEGSDRSAIVLRQGISARVVFSGRGVNGEKLATIVSRLQDDHNVSATFIDKTGVGASVCDFLRSFGRKFTGISFGGTPEDGRFMNRRAEMWWSMREWFEKDVSVEHNSDLKDDLIGPEYGVKDSGKIYLESKESMRERGLHSPDLADALALTFSLPVRAINAKSSKQNSFAKQFNPFAAIEGK